MNELKIVNFVEVKWKAHFKKIKPDIKQQKIIFLHKKQRYLIKCN